MKTMLSVLVVAVAAQAYFIVKLYENRASSSANCADGGIACIPEKQVQQIPSGPLTVQAPVLPFNSMPPVPKLSQQQSQNLSPMPPLPSNLGLNSQNMQQQPGLPNGMPPPQLIDPMTAWDDDSFFDDDDAFGRMDAMRDMMDHVMASMMQGGRSPLGASMTGAGPMGFHDSARISEEKDKYIVQLNMPGLDKSEIKTEVNGDMLTISGVQKQEMTSNVAGQSVSSGYSQRMFQNSMMLPGAVNADDIKVNYNKDILTIIIPKT